MRRCRFDLIWMLVVFWLGTCWVWAAEPNCYRSRGEAATQSGSRGVDGFRIESAQHDALSGLTWVVVKTCGHPEWPGVLVLAPSGEEMQRPANSSAALQARALVMLAGSRVSVVERGENVLIETTGVALSSGRIGDTVKVRLLPERGGDDANREEHFAIGVVRGARLLQMEIL